MSASSRVQTLFAALRFQLPDPTVDLFPQSASQFPAFPSLPIELRLKIWKLAFPAPRHVELVGPCVFGGCVFGTWAEYGPKERGKHYKKFNVLKAQFPVTLHVNQESRRECLRYYRVVFVKQDLAEEGVQLCHCDNDEQNQCLKIPLWIDPKVDSAYFDPSLSNDDTQEALNYIWAETSEAAAETCEVPKPSKMLESVTDESANIANPPKVNEPTDVLSTIQTLEIQHMESSSGFNKGILQYFTGLEDLCFTAHIPDEQLRQVEASKVLDDVMPYLYQQVEAKLREKMPRICFRY